MHDPALFEGPMAFGGNQPYFAALASPESSTKGFGRHRDRTFGRRFVFRFEPEARLFVDRSNPHHWPARTGARIIRPTGQIILWFAERKRVVA